MNTLANTLTNSAQLIRGAMSAVLLMGALTFPLSQAQAVSAAVQMACLSDYLAYCSQHAVGSQALRQCMSNAGARLSNRCVNALIAAGEVSKSEVSRRAASAK